MGTDRTFVVAVLYVSYRTEQKLIQRHQITMQDVEDAILNVRGLHGSWDNDPERGPRLLIRVTIRGRRALIVLYPTINPTEWNLGSAYFRQ